ncbi:MAG TPA: sensor histidine kinase [Acidimicrobiia bacterium]|nr:sensor histidine kinase [Acidimicrobiia bacterium]
MATQSDAHRPGFVGAWRGMSDGVRDGSFAVFLTFVSQVELLLADSEGPIAVQSISFAAMTLSVAWRRTMPLLAAALVGAGLVAQTLAGEAEVVGGFIAFLVVTYSVASYADLKTALLGGLFVLIGLSTFPVVNDINFADEVGNLAIVVGTWTLGRAVRSRQLRAVEAEDRVVAIEREREEKMRAVVAEERGRIARELHDIVAHGVSVMVLQAGAARQTLDRDPGKVRELLETVEHMGRQALDEMHRLLSVLRRSDEDPAATPPLKLAAIEQLVNDVRGTGLAVELRIEGEQRPLAPGMEASAYRIIQEALTNTIRHAQASSVHVVLRYDPDALELMIRDNGPGSTDGRSSDGHGLIGMRERAELFDGSVAAGPGQPNGWVVTARLPILARP